MYLNVLLVTQLLAQLYRVHSSVPPSCPPGFIYSVEQLQCQCIESSYNSLITCGPSCDVNKSATIIRGGWIGNYSGEILGGLSIYLYSLSDEHGISMPSDWSQVEDTLCGQLNRKGVLCGTCKEGYGTAITSHHQCVKCTNKDARLNWLWYILLEYVPLTVMFIVLVIFNINTTSGAGNAFIIFAQMITTAFDISHNGIIPLDNATHNNTRTVRAIYQLPYGIWNMEFFSILAPPFCLSSNIGIYDIIFINYAIALYPLLLIAIFSLFVWLHGKGLNIAALLCPPFYKCTLRIEKKWEFRRSIIGVFATFITMSYTKMLSTSVRLIMPTWLHDSNGVIVHANIPTFNGDVHYTDPDLIVMYIIAIVTLCVYIAILPCLLMTPSLIKAIYNRTRWEWLARILPWGRTQEFLDGFHGCYSDGGRSGNSDYRWFSGVFLSLRGLFFLTFIFTPSPMMTYMILCCLCFVTMFAIVCTRPFKLKHHNVLNVAVFCLLGVTSCINTFATYQSIMWLTVPTVLFWFEYLLVLLPLLVVSIKLIMWACHKYKKRKLATGNDNHLRNFNMDDDEDSIVNRDRGGDDSFNFLKFTEETGRMKRNNRDVTWYISSPDEDKSDVTSTGNLTRSSIHSYGTINN